MSCICEILEFLEDNLDVDSVQASANRVKKTLNFEQTDRIPLRIGYPFSRFSGYPYSEAFSDMEKMMVNELLGPCSLTEVPYDGLPMIRANYGVGILPSVFGLNNRIINNSMPWVDHLDSTEAVKRLMSSGVPDIRKGLGAKVFDTYAYFAEQMSPYPKCSSLIRMYHADLQGPFDVAHLIWGPDIYYALYDEPETVHELLSLVTETYILFMRDMKRVINDEDGGFNCHWGNLYKGRIVLRNDSAVNLSGEMYEEFIRPYDERIFSAFGSGSMHYCGRADQWVFRMMDCKGLEALNFGQPPNLVFGFDFIKKIYPAAAEKKLGIADYSLDQELLGKIHEEGYTTGITYLTSAANKEEALELLERVK